MDRLLLLLAPNSLGSTAGLGIAAAKSLNTFPPTHATALKLAQSQRPCSNISSPSRPPSFAWLDNGMPILPSTKNSLLVRTSFVDDESWADVLSVVMTENEDGFRAYVEVIDDPTWSKADWEQVRRAPLATGEQAAVLFIVDNAALEPDYPVLVVDLLDLEHEPFRCIASELWGVDNNLNIANMDWEEFADMAESDGIFRGFA